MPGQCCNHSKQCRNNVATNAVLGLKLLACSAGVFLGRANGLLTKPHAEKRAENGASQKERGRGRGERRENACPKNTAKMRNTP